MSDFDDTVSGPGAEDLDARLARMERTLQAAQHQVEGVVSSMRSAHADYDEALGQIASELGDIRRESGSPRPLGPDGNGSGSAGQWTAYEASTVALRTQMEGLREWFAWANPTLFFYRTQPHKWIPDCWERHPGVVEELLALYSAWRAAYADSEPSQHPVYWHGVFLGPAIERIMAEFDVQECERHGHRDVVSTTEPGTERQDLDPAADAIGTPVQLGKNAPSDPGATGARLPSYPGQDFGPGPTS